jgi:hypothetical protein
MGSPGIGFFSPKEVTVEKRKPDPARMQVLRSLPVEIKQKLSKEEADAFLYEEVWPESLYEKLQDYLVDDEESV